MRHTIKNYLYSRIYEEVLVLVQILKQELYWICNNIYNVS